MEDLLLRALDVRAASAPPAEAVRCAIEAWRSGPCVRRAPAPDSGAPAQRIPRGGIACPCPVPPATPYRTGGGADGCHRRSVLRGPGWGRRGEHGRHRPAPRLASDTGKGPVRGTGCGAGRTPGAASRRGRGPGRPSRRTRRGREDGVASALGRAAQRDGAVVLAGRCDEHAAQPFQPFAQALAHMVGHVPPKLVTALVGDAADDWSSFPPAHPESPHGEAPSPGPWSGLEPAAARYRLFDAVTAVLAMLAARKPTVLVIDDVHRAIPPRSTCYATSSSAAVHVACSS